VQDEVASLTISREVAAGKKGNRLAETPARYCSNCGHELEPEDQFCPNCGAPVHQAATVPTPEADVPVPPPPQQAGGSAVPPQQAQGTQRSGSRRFLLFGCLGLIGLLLLLIIIVVAVVAFGSSGDGGGGDSGGSGSGTNKSAQKDEQPAATSPAAAADEDTSTLTMTDVKMAADENGNNPTDVYSPNDTFYCVGYLKNAPDDTKITAVWIAADIEGVKQNTKIKQFSATGGNGLFRFNLSPAESWPTGKYEVELYLNDAKEPTKALAFEVR
jgi:Sec-independent protein translocase protein TatA